LDISTFFSKPIFETGASLMETKIENIVAFLGIDWADQKHDIHLSSPSGEKLEYRQIQHTPEVLSEWLTQLRQRFPQGHIAVCLEQSKGSLIYHLMGYDFLILYPINPKALARYREAFNTSGAKDDKPDAEFLCELIRCHRDRLRPWLPEDEQTRNIAALAEARRRAVDERTRVSNKLKSTLKGYFPQALQLVGENLYDPLSLAFLKQWPRLEEIQRTRDTTIRKFYTSQGSRSEQRISERIKLLRDAVPVTKDMAVITSAIITVQMLTGILATLNASIEKYEQKLKELIANHPDNDIFSSFPGAGDALIPRLLAAWGTDRQRFEAADEMQQYSGVAPITKRSGKTTVVQRRLACPKFMLQTFHEYARCSLRKSIWAKAFYDMLRERGKGHHSALRSLGFKWIRIMYRCWRDRTFYDEAQYIQALQRAHSPVLAYMAQ
jgi:transposase